MVNLKPFKTKLTSEDIKLIIKEDPDDNFMVSKI